MGAECEQQCGVENNSCSLSNPCPNNLFCNFEEGKEEGFCEGCPRHIFYCVNVTSSDAGNENCISKCDLQCTPKGSLEFTDLELEFSSMETNVMTGSPSLKATGPVVDCGLGLEPCDGAAGAVCFIERGKAPFFNKTSNCFAGGGIAAVIYNTEANCGNIEGTLSGQEAFIPVLSLTHFDGKAVLEKVNQLPPDKSLLATVGVGGPENEGCWTTCTKDRECVVPGYACNNDNGDFGDCTEDPFKQPCNDAPSFDTDFLPCTVEGEYCDFSQGKRGYCNACPEKEHECFFSDLNGLGAKECSKVCGSTDTDQQELESAPCKFCPRGSFDIGDIGEGFISTEQKEVETPCEFCASTSATTCSTVDRWDMEHPYRTIHMFGSRVECWAVAELYRSLNIEAESVACESARFFNYICGCSDSLGYAGADNEKKQSALVWLPRVGSILSIIGSTLMIIGVLRDEQKKKKVIGELIIFLCCFDILGSIGYAFTSAPTPKDDYIYGSGGNEATCTAQGFFIQIGTIALYANVSIAFYYLLIIQYSWREHTLRRSWVYYALFGVPLVVGFTFAFAGIPFYDNVVLWCNNSKNYWSEIPVIIGIAIATVVMVNLVWFVYQSERASRRFRRHSETERNSLSKTFFMQALVYLGSFYLTWPPYLALQLMIARGGAFSHYGFYLYAGTAVTLQGFWNFTFHTGLHTRALTKRISRAWTSVRTAAGSRSFFPSKSMIGKSEDMVGEESADTCGAKTSGANTSGANTSGPTSSNPNSSAGFSANDNSDKEPTGTL